MTNSGGSVLSVLKFRHYPYDDRYPLISHGSATRPTSSVRIALSILLSFESLQLFIGDLLDFRREIGTYVSWIWQITNLLYRMARGLESRSYNRLWIHIQCFQKLHGLWVKPSIYSATFKTIDPTFDPQRVFKQKSYHTAYCRTSRDVRKGVQAYRFYNVHLYAVPKLILSWTGVSVFPICYLDASHNSKFSDPRRSRQWIIIVMKAIMHHLQLHKYYHI